MFFSQAIHLKKTDSMETIENEAPRCVIYTADNTISSAYIVADNCVQMEIPKADVNRVLAGIIASYYVWNRSYPSVYQNQMQFFENQILDTPQKNFSIAVTKFVRQLNL